MSFQDPPANQTSSNNLPTELYTYSVNDGQCITIHTDPAGHWKAGVSATVWDSSLILSKYFERAFHDESFTGNELNRVLRQDRLRVLELGAGCSALPSMVLTHLRATMAAAVDPSTLSVTVTDKAVSLPLLNKSVNEQQPMIRSAIQVEELDWSSDVAQSKFVDRNWDLIIASDLLAFPELYKSLITQLKSLATSNSVVYIAYERRVFEKEVDFFKSIGEFFTFEMVPEEELDEIWRAPGEIYLYKARIRS